MTRYSPQFVFEKAMSLMTLQEIKPNIEALSLSYAESH
jgi:hypothetical protein